MSICVFVFLLPNLYKYTWDSKNKTLLDSIAQSTETHAKEKEVHKCAYSVVSFPSSETGGRSCLWLLESHWKKTGLDSEERDSYFKLRFPFS